MVVQKSEFALLESNSNLVYLDNAATTPICNAAKKVIDEFEKNNYGPVHRAQYSLSQRATALYEGARAKVAHYFGVNADNIIVTKGTTDGLNIVADGIAHKLNAGDSIVVTAAEHHSNFVCWQQLAKKTGAKLIVIPVDNRGIPKQDILESSIDQSTKVVALYHVSNVTGHQYDLAKIAKLIRSKSTQTLFVVDGAQGATIAHNKLVSFDVDAYACSSHKLYGPTGVGALYASDSLLATIKPTRYGGDMIDKVAIDSTEFAKPPQCFEPGTPPTTQLIGFAAALDFVAANQPGLQQISQYKKLVVDAIESNKLILLGENDSTSSIVSWVVKTEENFDSYDLAALLDNEGICVRSGHLCAQPLLDAVGATAAFRISFGLYTNQEDIDTFTIKLNKIINKL